MSWQSPGEKLRPSLKSSLDIPTPQTAPCTHRPPSVLEHVCLLCFRVCLWGGERVHALTNRTWRHFGSETQLLKGTQPLVKESLKGLKVLQRKDTYCRFCIFRACPGWAGTPTVLVCELSIVFPGGRGIPWTKALQCLLKSFSVTFCCVSKTHNKAFEQVSNLRCIFKKQEKKSVIVCA